MKIKKNYVYNAHYSGTTAVQKFAIHVLIRINKIQSYQIKYQTLCHHTQKYQT